MLELGIRFFCSDKLHCVWNMYFVCAHLYISVWAPEVNTGSPQSFSTLVFKIGGIFYWTQNWQTQQGRLARGSRDILVSLISASGICALNLPHWDFLVGAEAPNSGLHVCIIRTLQIKSFSQSLKLPFLAHRILLNPLIASGVTHKKIKTRKKVSTSSIEKNTFNEQYLVEGKQESGKGLFLCCKADASPDRKTMCDRETQAAGFAPLFTIIT